MDDHGWGDVGANDPSVRETPHIDALAASGTRFTDFHVGFSVCTPSRAALLTGRLCPRTGVCSNFGPTSMYGMAPTERTVADVLGGAGYATHMIGKWHLGHNPPFHPTYRGFGTYYGLPYSGDMGCLDSTPQSCVNGRRGTPACPALCPFDGAKDHSETAIPLYDSLGYNCSGRPGRAGCEADIVEQPFNPFTLNARYAARAGEIISSAAAQPADARRPFLLYVAFAHTHTPLGYDEGRYNASARPGLERHFGNTLAEVDGAIGSIHSAIRSSGLANDTLIFLTADNGPADLPVVECFAIGSPGPYTGAWQRSSSGGGGGGVCKGTQWEGGHRMVAIASWAGRVPVAVSSALLSSTDLLPTFAALAGVALPADRIYDGVDASGLLLGRAQTARATLFHPHQHGDPSSESERRRMVPAMRIGKYKAHWVTYAPGSCLLMNGTHRHGEGRTIEHDPPLLFDVDSDPAESTPLDPDSHADLVAKVRAEYDKFWASVRSEPAGNTSYAAAAEFRPCSNATSACCRLG